MLSIVECIDSYPEEEIQLKLSTLPQFNLAMDYYQERRFDLAIEIFQNILDIDPDDDAAEYILNIAFKYSRNGVPDNWTGAVEMLHK